MSSPRKITTSRAASSLRRSATALGPELRRWQQVDHPRPVGRRDRELGTSRRPLGRNRRKVGERRLEAERLLDRRLPVVKQSTTS